MVSSWARAAAALRGMAGLPCVTDTSWMEGALAGALEQGEQVAQRDQALRPGGDGRRVIIETWT